MAGSAVTLVRPPTQLPCTTPLQGAALLLENSTSSSRRTHGFVLTTSAVMADDTGILLGTNTPTDNNNNRWEQQQQCHDEDDDNVPIRRRPRSGSEGLDFLAALAEQERTALRRSSAQELMPPPRPRRPRSVSEDSMLHYEPPTSSNRRLRCLVLPASILEEELAEVNAVVQQDSIGETSDDPVTILTNARARILEDVLEECAGEKGESTILPHTLIKYQEVRVGETRIFVNVGTWLEQHSHTLDSDFFYTYSTLVVQSLWSHRYIHTRGTSCRTGPLLR